VVVDCGSPDVVGLLRDAFDDSVVTDFADIADAALNIYRRTK